MIGSVAASAAAGNTVLSVFSVAGLDGVLDWTQVVQALDRLGDVGLDLNRVPLVLSLSKQHHNQLSPSLSLAQSRGQNFKLE